MEKRILENVKCSQSAFLLGQKYWREQLYYMKLSNINCIRKSSTGMLTPVFGSPGVASGGGSGI